MTLLNLAFIASVFLATVPIVSTQDTPGQYVTSHSLQSPYTHTEFENEWWDFGGTTLVRVYDYVRLTSQAKSQQGWLWSKTPLQSKAWTVEFEFKIHGDNPTYHGDGFAFWFTNKFYEPGSAFGHKDSFTGLAVFFDTFSNGAHDHSFPYISAMLGDGKKTYDHQNDNKASMSGHGCEANIRGNEASKARVTYFKNHVLQVEFIDKIRSTWETCFALSNVTLPDSGYIGFTSATGDLFDNHDIIRVSSSKHLFTETYDGQDAVDGQTSSEQDEGRPNSWSFIGFLMSLIKLIGFGAVCAGMFYAYRAYSAKNMKRF